MQTEKSIDIHSGDDGTTSLLGGERFPKDHSLFECLGTIDELNAFLGDAKASANSVNAQIYESQSFIVETIDGIQKDLFAISGIIAGSKSRMPGIEKLDVLVGKIKPELPPSKGFAIPGENILSAKLHIARAVCRRAERRLISIGSIESVPAEEYSHLLTWFNRLSYLLFLLAQMGSNAH